MSDFHHCDAVSLIANPKDSTLWRITRITNIPTSRNRRLNASVHCRLGYGLTSSLNLMRRNTLLFNKLHEAYLLVTDRSKLQKKPTIHFEPILQASRKPLGLGQTVMTACASSASQLRDPERQPTLGYRGNVTY